MIAFTWNSGRMNRLWSDSLMSVFDAFISTMLTVGVIEHHTLGRPVVPDV